MLTRCVSREHKNENPGLGKGRGLKGIGRLNDDGDPALIKRIFHTIGRDKMEGPLRNLEGLVAVTRPGVTKKCEKLAALGAIVRSM